MFITGSEEKGFKIHFNHNDMQASAGMIGGNILVELTADKAKELEDRLEEVVYPKGTVRRRTIIE